MCTQIASARQRPHSIPLPILVLNAGRIAFQKPSTGDQRFGDIPDSDTAHNLAAAAIGFEPVEIRRFRTGSAHYVFEALFKDRAPVVIRMAVSRDRKAMAGAQTLSRLLRPLDVPVPEILAEGLDNEFPYLILERLPALIWAMSSLISRIPIFKLLQ
jgi:hypothetical protein